MRRYLCSVDVTRVEQWIPLRENFSLPFLWAQLAVLTVYFRPSLSPVVEVYVSWLFCRWCNRNALKMHYRFVFGQYSTTLPELELDLHVVGHWLSLNWVCQSTEMPNKYLKCIFGRYLTQSDTFGSGHRSKQAGSNSWHPRHFYFCWSSSWCQ